MDGVKRSGIEVLSHKDVSLVKLRKIWDNVPYFGDDIDEQVEIDSHYLGYLKRQSHDIEAFKKDESIIIPLDMGKL